MGALWRHRIARDDKGKLHFVYARYRSDDLGYRCGMYPNINNTGNSVEDMRQLVHELEAACRDPVIEMTETGDEPNEDDKNATKRQHY